MAYDGSLGGYSDDNQSLRLSLDLKVSYYFNIT